MNRKNKSCPHRAGRRDTANQEAATDDGTMRTVVAPAEAQSDVRRSRRQRVHSCYQSLELNLSLTMHLHILSFSMSL